MKTAVAIRLASITDCFEIKISRNDTQTFKTEPKKSTEGLSHQRQFAQPCLPLTREVARHSRDGGREKVKMLQLM